VLTLERVQHAKAVERRHLHVEKNQIGRQGANGFDSLRSIVALAHDLHVRLGGEAAFETFARELHVVNNQRSYHPFYFSLRGKED